MQPLAAPGSAPGAPPQTPLHITSTIEAYLAEHPDSILLEDGHTLFDLREAQYALTAEHDRATLHLWSDDCNLVRRILAVTPRSESLRLTTQRFGHTRPQTLELTHGRELRSPTTRHTARERFLRVLDRVFLRAFPDDRSEGLRSAMDLERSFGPAYARGSLTRGTEAWAVIAVNGAETQATVDGILTVGILWLQHCRDHAAPTSTRKGRLYVGLRIIVPRGGASATLSRLPWLSNRIARYELYELDEQTEDLTRRDPADHGNLSTRLIQAPNEAKALDRFAEAIPQVLALLPPGTRLLGLNSQPQSIPASARPEPTPHSSAQPELPPQPQSRPEPPLHPPSRPEPKAQWRDPLTSNSSPVPPSPAIHPTNRGPHRNVWVANTSATEHPHNPAHRNSHTAPATQTCELRLRSNTELAFLLHGLEFARIRSAFIGQSFNRQLQVTVGSGPAETTLLPSTQSHLREVVRHLFDRRRAPSTEPSHTVPAPSTTQDPLFRTQPERWLESTLRADLSALDPALEPSPVYTQVPAFTGGGANLDRGMLDLLAVTRANRLAVIELKADEDLHLALQGLDYWIRVRHHHLANVDPSTGLGDLQQHGYFPQTRLSSDPPHLFLVAPALHIHPATETILRHLDPRVTWTLVALDERWRTRIKPIWRKHSSGLRPDPLPSFS